MKKTLLLILLFAGMANAQIVNIPDANFKARLIALGLDTNTNGEIDAGEAASITILDVSDSQITDMTGIEAFTNVNLLICQNNNIVNLNVSSLTGLITLICANNHIENLNISGLLLNSLNCDKNELTTLDVSGMFTLGNLSCSDNHLTALDLSALTNLSSLTCYRNNLFSLDLTGMSNLFMLDCSMNNITSLDLSSLTGLSTLSCGYNPLTSLDASMLPDLGYLNCYHSAITSINVSGMTALHDLDISYNQISTLDVTGLVHIDEIYCGNNLFTSLDVNSLTTLTFFGCEGNQLTSIDVSALVNLYYLNVAFNQLTALNTSTLTSLGNLNFTSNTITSIDLSNNNALEFLNASINQLTALNVSNLSQLKILICGNNAIPTVDFSGLTQLVELYVDSTGRTSIDVTNQPLLTKLYCANNPISTIDVSSLLFLNEFSFGSTSLTQVFMKNGRDETLSLTVPSPNLQFVCADESQLPYILSVLVPVGASNAVATSYCSFVPGGDFNTITGHVRFDAADNGCDASDIAANNLKISITNGTTTEASVVNPSAAYAFYTSSGDYTLTPQLENPAYFTLSPPTASVNFPALDNSTQTQDFCLAANGIHPDLEVVLTPVGAARPGFDANYRLVYKNKGNQTLSGTVNLIFDDAKADFISAIPAVNSQTLNSLIWNYSDLQPFESREIDFTLNINSPLEIPAVNSGDMLDFTASINFASGDDTPADNISVLHQTVVNSLDPNVKTCLEGAVVSPEEIGNYLHYNIEFENLGTAEAVNVVVKDLIDPNMFDINSLQVLYASHEMRASIRGNTLEFVFENINLAPAEGNPPVGGHGNVLFKIRTLPTLASGAHVENKANIYFDYNAPIETNAARTTFQMLGNPDFNTDQSVVMFPNSGKSHISIKCNSMIRTVELFDIQGRMLQTAIVNSEAKMLDISDKSSGIYFIRITTEKGMKTEKLVKE